MAQSIRKQGYDARLSGLSRAWRILRSQLWLRQSKEYAYEASFGFAKSKEYAYEASFGFAKGKEYAYEASFGFAKAYRW
ncbi:hypothetical protein [Paenibacillus sp. URB8-2]|uniref:hypothetical protein n=1 Tax=Paenibacillus sp. URB8-2 TaxID=2741301 RepID=UPI0015B8A2C1|nr:hypothetical protein [Paenibacillus sp. URB8-2]BCG61383.1 hypothetical protein PUR_48080 [Paenibacillus sp. URB8-2]